MTSFRKSLPVARLILQALIVLTLAMLMATTVTAQAPSARVANSSQPQITFAKDVVPILQAKCQDCHHTGGMAPMSLVTYEEARPWAKAMKQRVETRVMPPWHLDKTVGIQRFQNDLSLSDEQIATIVRWVDEGAPLGNPKDLPAPKQWPSEDGWQLAKQFGAPDLVIDTGSYTMPAHGKNYDIYRPDTGKLLMPGAHIWWELHLHAVGEEITDHAQLAIYLYPKGQEPKYRTY